jgi:DNA-binding transcriptional LysR family regulator
MNITFLKYFYDTVKLKSVTAAASANHVTQSAISQGITQLEKSLSVSLLTHKRNSIKVTPEGEAVFERGRLIFREIDGLKLLLKQNQNAYVGQLSFACSHSLALSILPELLAKFQQMAPSVTPRVIFGHTGLIKNWIKQGDIEFGLVLDNDDLSSFSLKHLSAGAFRFFQSRQRPKNQPIKSCLFPPARAEVYLIKQLFLKKFGCELVTEMEICSWEVIAKLIGLTSSVGFIPDYVAWGADKVSSIQLSDLDLNIPYNIYAAYPLEEELSRNATLFLKIAKEIFNSTLQHF